jgi:cobalt-zinc-cadmium efflux system outer membrane protein
MKATMGAAMLIIAAAGPCSVHAEQGGSEMVTFEQLWVHARRHSPYLVAAKSQQARLEAAEAKVRPVLAQNPTVAVQAGPRLQAGYRNYDISASLSQPIRIAGESGRERALAEEATSRIATEVETEETALRQTLRAAFRTAAALRDRAAVLGVATESQQRVLALVSKQVGAGDASPLNERLAEVEAVQAKQASMAVRQALTGARLRLAELAGWSPASLPDVHEQVSPLGLPAREELIREAQARAPRLRLLRARLREAQAQIGVSDRQRFTEPELGVAYARQGTTPASDPISHTIFATVALPVPLWFRNQPERAESRAAHAVAQAELASEEQLVAAELLRAYAEVDALTQRVALYEGSLLPKFAEHLTLIEKALAFGEITIFDFISARTRLLQAQLEAIDVRIAYSDALSKLEQIIGYELGSQKAGAP